MSSPEKMEKSTEEVISRKKEKRKKKEADLETKRKKEAEKNKKILEKKILKSRKKDEEKEKDIDLEAEWNRPETISRKQKFNMEEHTENINRGLPKLILDSITYTMMTNEEMEALSVVNVGSIAKPNEDPGNLIGTTEDLRMGTLENNLLCGSCGKTNDDCPGHLGMIKLPDIFIHPYQRKYVMMILQSVCHCCGNLIVPRETLKRTGVFNLSGYARLSKIVEMSSSSKSCDCKHQNPIFKPTEATSNDNVSMPCKFPGATKKARKEMDLLSPEAIHSILKKIPDEDIKAMGFGAGNHPVNFITNFIPVIPPAARPAAVRDGIHRKDYITTLYDDIIRNIDNYNKGGDESLKKQIIGLFSTLIVNRDQKSKTGTSETKTVIDNRISGKKALIREALLGKRCDYSARTTIGPNRKLKFGEVALPRFYQSRLTVPEVVTIYNYERIVNLAKEGRITAIKSNNGNGLGSSFIYKGQAIQLEDIVDRWCEDYDSVICNRNPTLQKGSMPGMLVKFQDKFSTGLHLSSTSQLNADFDGDELTTHMMREVLARIEARTFMNSTAICMSAHTSTPAASLVYNAISGAYLLSKQEKLEEQYFVEGIMTTRGLGENIATLDKRLRKLAEEGIVVEKFSGRSLISILFPEDFWYENYSDPDNVVEIKNGILIRGILTKATVGNSSNGIVQSLWKWGGQQAIFSFITNATFMFNWFDSWYGLTVSLEDCQLKKEDQEEVNKLLENNVKKMNDEIESLPKLSENASLFDREDREREIKNITDKYTSEVTKFVSNNLPETNNINIMAKSGAKGKAADTVKTIGLLGQIYVENQRPQKMISKGTRWLTYFSMDDDSIFSQGFARNSYRTGLNPAEYFAVAQAGRIGLSDTAVRTADVGALNRRMIKSLEDLTIRYDGSVRNASNTIFQMSYGAGFDPSNMVNSRSKNGNSLLSFINISEAVGRANAEKGYTSSLPDKIRGIAANL